VTFIASGCWGPLAIPYVSNNHRAGANLQGVKELSMGIVDVRSGRWPRHQQVGAALPQEGTAASTSGSWGTAPASWSCAKRLPLLSCGSGRRHWRAQAVWAWNRQARAQINWCKTSNFPDSRVDKWLYKKLGSFPMLVLAMCFNVLPVCCFS
jgi:hypothetical protein